jgi:integrase/recombinase XerD
VHHSLTTYLKVKQDVQGKRIDHIRGDTDGTEAPRDSIDHYIRTYYDDVEPIDRERIFKLHI